MAPVMLGTILTFMDLGFFSGLVRGTVCCLPSVVTVLH